MKKFIKRSFVLLAIISVLCCHLAIPATALEINEGYMDSTYSIYASTPYSLYYDQYLNYLPGMNTYDYIYTIHDLYRPNTQYFASHTSLEGTELLADGTRLEVLGSMRVIDYGLTYYTNSDRDYTTEQNGIAYVVWDLDVTDDVYRIETEHGYLINGVGEYPGYIGYYVDGSDF